VVVLEERMRLLGGNVVAAQLFLAELAKMNVPSFVGGDANALLNYMPMRVAVEMIDKAIGASPPNGPAITRPQRLPITGPEQPWSEPPLPEQPRSDRRRLIPVYVVLDESSPAWVDSLDAGLMSLCLSLADAPSISRVVRLSVLGYAADVAERLALQEVRAGAVHAKLVARGGARFGAAFEWLLDRVGRDAEQLT